MGQLYLHISLITLDYFYLIPYNKYYGIKHYRNIKLVRVNMSILLHLIIKCEFIYIVVYVCVYVCNFISIIVTTLLNLKVYIVNVYTFIIFII